MAVEFQEPFSYQSPKSGILALQAGFAFRSLSGLTRLRNVDQKDQLLRGQPIVQGVTVLSPAPFIQREGRGCDTPMVLIA